MEIYPLADTHLEFIPDQATLAHSMGVRLKRRLLIRRQTFGPPEDKTMREGPLFSFHQSVARAFGFLESHGFGIVKPSDWRVRYESPKVYLELVYGWWDHEVSLVFGRSNSEESFSFTLFLRLKNPNLERELGEMLADDEAEVERCLERIAAALRSEGIDILRGKNLVFDQMTGVRWWHFSPHALKSSSNHRPKENDPAGHPPRGHR